MSSPLQPAQRIGRQLERLAHLRGLGPTPDGYARWIDQTRYLLISIFGEGSSEANSFSHAIGEQASAFGLALAGEWGVWARLERGEAILREILARLRTTGQKDSTA